MSHNLFHPDFSFLKANRTGFFFLPVSGIRAWLIIIRLLGVDKILSYRIRNSGCLYNSCYPSEFLLPGIH